MKPPELLTHLATTVAGVEAPQPSAAERKRFDEADRELRLRAYFLFIRAGRRHPIDTTTLHDEGSPTTVTRKVLSIKFEAAEAIQQLVPDSGSTIFQVMTIGIHNVEHQVGSGKPRQVRAASCDVVTAFVAERTDPAGDEDTFDYDHPLHDETVLERTNVNHPVFDHTRKFSSEVLLGDDLIDANDAFEATRRYKERGGEAVFVGIHAALDDFERELDLPPMTETSLY